VHCQHCIQRTERDDVRLAVLVEITAGDAMFRASASEKKFPGFTIVYDRSAKEVITDSASEKLAEEGEEDDEAGNLPDLKKGEELKLKEASFVKDPMNRLAVVDQLKTDGLLTVDEFKSLSDGDREDHLRSLGLSQTWAKYLVKCTREAGTSRSSQREAGAVSADMPAFGDFLSALKATANR